MISDQELAESQRRTADALLEQDLSDGLTKAAAGVSEMLLRVADDDELWNEIRDATGNTIPARQRDLAREQLALLISLDWEPVLAAADYQPPPPSVDVAAELVRLTSEAKNRPDDDTWHTLRERLAGLGQQLAGDAKNPPPQENHSAWRRIKDRVGFGISSIRRIRVAKLLAGVIKEPAKLSATGAVAFIAGTTAVGITPLALLGAAAGGLVVALITEFQAEATAEEEARQRSGLDEVAFALGPIPGEGSSLRVTLNVIADAATHGHATADNVNLEIIDLRKWAAGVGAVLADAWGYIAAHLPGPGLSLVTVTSKALDMLRIALADVVDAVRIGSRNRIRHAIEQADLNLEAIIQSVNDLSSLLVHQGGTPH